MASVVASFSGNSSAGSATQASQAGDIFFAMAFRDGSTTAPTAPAGWNVVAASGASTCSMTTAYRVATGATTDISGTWTNANAIIIGQFRPATGKVIALGGFAGQGASSTTVNYPAVTSINGGQSSYYIGVAGHRSLDTNTQNAPLGMTNITSYEGTVTTCEVAMHWTNGLDAAWTSENVSVGGTAQGWRSIVIEMIEYDPALSTIEIDPSTPARVSNTTNTVTSASFTAPAGALLVCVASADANGGVQAYTFSDSGGLTWTQQAIQQAAGSGSAVIGTAVVGAAVARTVTVTKTVSGGTFSQKCYVVTGVDAADPIGTTGTGTATANNIQPAAFTTTAADSFAFVAATEWENLGAPVSSDLIFDGIAGTGISLVSGYRYLGPTGAKGINLNAGGTGTADWDWCALEVLAGDAGGALTIAAAAGSYTINGIAANLEMGREVAAAAGSYAVTGTAASLEFGREVLAASGSYSITGTDATFSRTYEIGAVSGSYAVTGTAASLEIGREIAAQAGSYTVTGTVANLERGREVQIAAGSYLISGQNANLVILAPGEDTFTAEPGSYQVSGTQSALLVGRLIGAGIGSYSLVGADAQLNYIASESLLAESGSYLVSGTNASLRMSREIAAENGSYSVVGSAAALGRHHPIVTEAGEYSYGGGAATLYIGRRVVAQSASYSLTGQPASLDYSEYVAPPVPASRTLVASDPNPNVVLGTDERTIVAPNQPRQILTRRGQYGN